MKYYKCLSSFKINERVNVYFFRVVEVKKPASQEIIKSKKKVEIVTETTIKNMDNSKITGPVNGNECYFWRTTGCLYADKCRYEHIKKNKGIDKKPWHK